MPILFLGPFLEPYELFNYIFIYIRLPSYIVTCTVYIYNTSSYATIITHFIRRYMYNTSSYATIVTLNLYVNTSFLQMAAFRKL